jgi:polygalacturonase
MDIAISTQINGPVVVRLMALGCLAMALSCTQAGRPEVVIDAANRGAIGDGTALNTTAIQTAIDSLSARGGGVLSFPPGRYVTGTIQLKDRVRLRLADGAVLLGSQNPDDYRNLDPFTTGDGGHFGYALITALGAKNVGIEGAGTIDGQGKELKAAQSPYDVRPFLIRWEHCTDVTLRDVHLANPGAWTMQFFQCSDVVADHVTIRSAESHLANCDGMDIDSSHDVRITNCDIESGDDAVCIKATSPVASHDIFVSGCSLKTRCNGIKLGTESLGDFYNIHAERCRMNDIGMAGIALYSVDGAQLRDVSIADIEMNNVTVPISIRLGARLKTFRPDDKPRPVGILRDVSIANVHAVGAKQIGMLINGIPDHPIENLRLKNVDITLPGGGTASDAEVKLAELETAYPEYKMFGKVMPVFGAYIRHVRDMSCAVVKLTVTAPDARPGVSLIDVKGVAAGDFAVAVPEK